MNTFDWDPAPEKSLNEKLKDGQSMEDGLAGKTPLREPHERPWTTRVHKPTRGNDDE